MGWLDLILKLNDLFIVGSLTYERFVEMNARIKEMKAEGRDPTREEFNEIFDSIDENTQRIVDADKRLNPE